MYFTNRESSLDPATANYLKWLNLDFDVPFTRLQADVITGFLTSMIRPVFVQSRSSICLAKKSKAV
jgi:hypothetical protein